MKVKLVTLLLLTGYLSIAQSNSVGIFKNNADIGNPKIKGAAAFDANTQTYNIKGGG
jgi:TolB protein